MHQTSFGPKAAQALAEGPLLAGLRWLALANRSGLGSAPLGPKGAQDKFLG